MESRETGMSEYKGPKYPTEAHGPIPAFHSYEEEADFWDETDTGAPDFEAALTPVQVRSTQGRLTRHMMLRLDEETDDAIEQFAREQGLKKTTLARVWLVDRLRQERERHAS